MTRVQTKIVRQSVLVKGQSVVFSSEQAGSPIYYEPNSKKYGAKNYVPDYESSVLLSRSNKIIR